ncbi:histone-lysine N-methyltransferase 2C isoform X3 [Oryzias latipes]|uniref:histone-lysine N-methyltransferase 2C isoform X3 n=1 Tax=Oryzias latipes TaxID=8090 RepID=UPI000CE268F6|nr:histone-lysine N-methyltransferase 2C isoform X3 [Oryzias latipes]
MPSEAHPQEPRDRGPPSLITRAGRNAQLAKAAHNSPAQDKRPRGRPRKDGSNGRPAPPPAPPPPPPRSSRKKGRSRGQAQVENEESMDAAEKEEPQKTELKEVRAAGRRRSTSRRKPDTNPDLDLDPDPDPDPDPEPEPSQERLSPPPEPEPGTVSKSSPEPPSTAEKDLTSPPPTVLLPPPSPEEHPNVCSVLPPPDLNLSPRLDPSPVEEERPSLIRSPAERSPAPSLRCSPPVSPCLRLDDEDEDSLSPMYQRSLSEDSGGSPTPILGHAKKRRKQCAFCYRGDEPLLGLGRLVVFGPTPGYIPLHILNRRTSSDRDSDCHEHCFHDSQAPPTCSSPEQCDESSSEFMKQLGPIGLPHDIDVQSLFDATGQCCAHLQCATWSEGVRRGEGQSLLFVDKAIDSGSIQVCAFCRHLGASLRCQETGCTRSYHMPCAAAAGACQDWNQRRILCTQHARTGSSQCRLCAGSGDSGGLLMCSCCGSCYHGSCLDPPVTPSPLSRVGWQCPQCRVCRSCSLQGDSGVLLCARCDKAYHAHCLTPPLDDAPHAAWTCKNCRTCRRCGVSSSGRWANNPFLCESCDLALPCPLCDRTPDSHTPQDYLTCSCCYRCVHVECSVQAGEGRAGSEGYICFSCKPQESEEPISQSHSPAPPTDVLQPRPPSNPDVHSADSPVQLLCSEVAQSPASGVCVPSPQHLTPPPPATEPSAAVSLSDAQPSPSQTHTDSPNSQLLHAKEIYQSPAESPADIQQEVHRSQTPSSPNLQKDLALCLEEIGQSPALSSEEIHQQSATDLQQNSLLSSEDIQPNPVKSLLDFSHILPPSPSDLQIPSPPPKEVFHGLTSEIHQNLISSSDEIDPSSSTPSENIQKVSLESLEEIQQSPGASSMDIQQSNEDSSAEIHQNQAPPSLKVQKDLAPLNQKGIQQSPTGPSESLPTSPTASLEEIQQNPKSPLEKACQSPGAHLQEMAQSPTAPSEKITASPAASLEEIQESPKSFTEKTHQSPGAHFEEMVQSPTGPLEKIAASPAASLEEIQESPKSFTEEIHQSPTAPFEEMVLSPTGPSEKASSNPVVSVEEIQESPKSFLEKIHQSPGAHLQEMVQSPTAPSEKASSSPAVSVEEIQESPKSFTEKIHQSPVAHFEEMVQSPTGPSEEITASTAASLKEIQESPKSPTEESPAAPLDEMVLSPASPAEKVLTTLEPCLAEVLPILGPPCEDICQSDGKLSPDLQQEPPLPGDNPQDPQTSPASMPLPAEFHESPAQTPKIDNHSPAPCPEEDLGPSTVSPSSLIDSSQSPGSLNTKLQQSSASTLEDGAQSPSPITEVITHDPERLVSKLQENYPQSPSEPQQCSALSSEKACGAPEPQPGVNQDRDDSSDQKSAPSSQEFLPNPEQSPTDLNKSPNIGSEENQPSPVSSPKEIAHGSVISAAEAAEVRDGPSENADPIDFDETPSSSHTHQEEPLPYHSGSSPSPAEIQQSQTCQTSSVHAQQNPSDLGPTMALKPREDQSPVQETSMSLLEQSPAQSGLVCTREVSEPEHSPPPSSAGQEDETQLSKSFSPLNATPSQQDYSPQPGQLSPAQGGTSPQCSKQEAEPNLDQKNPVEAPHISALNQDHPPDYCRPSSAPCSPCAFPPMPRPLSLSQPASPAQLQAPAASDLGLNQHHTLEVNPGSFSSTSALPIGPCVETSPLIPPVQTPESLEHISTSQEHSSLNFLPSGEETKGSHSPLNSVDHSPCGGPSPCADAIEPASVSLSQLTPAESSVTCQSQSPPDVISVASEICLPVQPTSPMAPTETCSVEPEPAWDPEHEKLQQAESDPRSPENPAHSETPSFPPRDVCSLAEMDSPPASSSSPHCALIVPQDQDDQYSSCPAAATQSPPRSPANRVSLIPSDLAQKDSSPEQTAPTSISLPQAAESESPSSSPHHLEHGATTSTSLTKAPLSPSSVLPLDHLASSARPINPSAAQLDPECVPQISQTPVDTPSDPDAPKSESVVSQLGPALSDNSSQVAAQHASPVQTGPAQDNTVMPCTTFSSEASATPPSPTHNEVSPPQVASPLPPQAQYSPSHRSPIASPACDLVASETQGPDPCPENSEVIPGLHAVFPEAETCPDLVLTNAAQLKSGPASLQSAAANDNVEKKPTSSKEDFHYPAQESPEEDQGGEEAEEVQSLLRTVQARSPSEIPKDQPTDAPLSCSPTPFSPPVACSSPPPQSPLSSPPPGKDEALPPLMIRIPCAENSTKVEESTPVSQSISPIDFVSTMTEPTKDEDRSRAKPSQKEEELQADGCLGWEEPPMNEKLEVKEAKTHQSDVEEEVKPISPVLDLGSSLDMEVMELMTSSPPPSLLHPSSPNSPAPSCRGKGRILRPPPCSSRPSDDLSIRLRQSPFSTEASPETSPARTPVTPPPLTPPSPPLMCRDSPPLFESQAPPTVLPFTPKIGMGKPAISKRKFSSGRARVKQGLWWSSRRTLSPPSSSQDSMGEAGWESSKLDSPLWSSTVGRGSGFPGRRRSRGGGVGGGRGGRGRSRLRTMDGLAVTTATGFVEPFQTKEEEENSMHNTVVMFSTSDHFTLKQDMCVVCGSFGQGAEGRLLACSQCGQCYHPYCVNIKITRVILTKGWRCLECTVCEACGDASDPGRLLLCDDCDISYHTYCLDPPLHTVPKGAWKCKWCVWCVQCGSTSPGVHSDWQRNYSLCGPCCSLSRCPACQQAYAEDDLILQCQQCDRWVHATCQGLCTEDEVEVAADEGFDCSLCKAHERGTYGRAEALGPHVPHIMSKIREPDTKIYTQDGVCLTESGLSQLQSLVEPLSSPRRYRRCKPKLKLRITNQNSVFVLQTPVHGDLSLEQEHGRGELDCDMKSDSSPERDRVLDDDLTKDSEVCDNSKKRKRKPYRPGIGGFMVRQRGGKAGPSRMKLCRKDSMEGEGMLDAEVSMETAPCAGPVMDKVKRRYRKKKGKLEEAFPSYLQEAFFGRDLLDRSRQLEKAVGGEVQGSLQTGVATDHIKVPVNGSQGLHTGLSASAMATNRKQGTLPISEEALVDLSDVLNTDPHILATGHAGQFQVERSPSPFAGLDINSMSDNPSLTSDPAGGCSRGLKVAQDEPLDAILSPELDKMVSDGAILGRLYKIPELEGKDVEEVFTAVLSPGSRSSQPDPNQHAHASAVTKLHTQAAAFPRLPLMNGLMESAPRFPMIPGGPQGEAGFRMAHPEGPGSTPVQGTAPASASASQAAECEQDGLSTAQRGMLKWEKEESLGELATVAPVLYCNTNFPHLKEQYPDWPTRVKQIAKLWRKASSQDRAPFVQKARDNRAAQRINKVQLSNDPMKHLQPSQQQQQTQPPPPGAFDPVSMELEMSFKDPLRPRESEQEQEWKMRQQMRQKSKQLAKMEATQKLEQVKNEQRQQQQLLSSQRRPDCLSPESCSLLDHTHQSGSGDSTSPLHLPPGGRQHPNLQGGSAPADDVFLRPQAPAPSGLSSLPHSPHASSPLHQPPSSPQMFSPPSSRPSSPWDPYSKVPGTPRPQTAPTPQLQQRGNSLTSSPSHDAMNSPIPSPDSKDAPRVPGPQTGLQQSRSGMLSPSSGIRTLDTHQRTNTRGDVFKAPMPPQLQLQQEVLGSTAGGRRDPSRPADLGYSLAQPQQDLSFPSSPLSGLGSPHRSPYSQAPGTPRPDCSDPFSQQSPLSSRPSPDPYSNPQTPGTPRSHSDPSYLTTPPALRLDHYNQQPATQRPSPSHPPLEPYASNPGTPRPSDRIPRSPVNQRSSDPYCQPVGTPRPPTEPYTQQPSTPCSHKSQESFSQTAGESFLPQHGACGTSPLTLGLSTEPGAFTPTPHQRSPGKQPDSFPRTPKHLGNPDEASLNPGQDPFEQGHMTRGSSQTESKTANMMSAAPSLDGPMSVLADSEEKLRQRQRLRQLLLWQQQQKNALRQEKALQEPPAPHSWSQDNSSSAPTAAGFGRPPPPYPGTVRPCGPPTPRFPTRFPVEQQSGFTSMEDTFPRQSMPRELAVRPPDVRFGALTGVQESLLHHPQGQAEGHPVQMRRPADFSNIHPMMGTNMMPGLPQPFIPRPHPVQQHNMPYIELRHRAPESRLRLPFPLSATPDLKGPLLNPRDPHTAMVRAGHGPLRLGDTMLGQQMVMSGGIEQLSQQHMAHSVALGQSGETTMPGPDGIEHLDGEDSAVKDLEDVEVKDLVDLNLNLDPEDGKEDLDLGPNDLHLDDFLLSGKFDLIAYAMDMVNEELDLGEPVEEKEGREKRDGSGSSKRTESHAHLPEKVKQEGEGAMKTESGSVLSAAQLPTKHLRGPAPPGGEGVETGLPGVVNKDKLEHSGRVAGSGLQPLDPPPPTGMARAPLPAGHPPVFQQQRPFTPSPHPHTNLGGTSGPAHPVPVQPHVLLTPQSQPASSTQAQTQSQNQNKARPLLLEEQPLLLQDLLDQERQEQQQQKQMQALIRQKPASEPVLPNTADFDSIPDPIMKAKMLALQGINKVMSQGSLGLNPMVINRFQQAPVAPGPEGPLQPPQVVPQDGKLNPQLVRRNPPSSGSGFVNESQRRKYEEWLGETQQLLQMQQRLLEDQISTHRKAKKALSAKQRTAKKAGRAFAEEDAAQLRYISEQQGVVQKQLEQIRKQQKDHTELIEDYKNKQQRPLPLPETPQKTLPQPLAPIPPHQGGPTQSRLPNASPGWNPGAGPPRPVGQRMPLHLPPQMTPRLPNNPQTASTMVPPLTPPTAAFTAGPRGPAGGLGGTSGDGTAPTPQVKFDDNNPFSEGFQERERRERLREQQERQRVQLMQEVERHRALQKKLEQQDLEPSGSVAKGVSSTPGGDGLTHLTFLSSEPGLDLLQSSSSSSRTTLQHQGQAGRPFPPQTGLQQGFTGERLHPGPHPAADLISGQTSEGGRDVASSLQNRQRLTALPGATAQSQRLTAATPMTPSQPQCHHFEHDSSSSSPLNPPPSSFPCAAGSPASLLQMYSDITTEDKPTKRSRKKEGEDTAGGAKTPLSPHSDITAPPTPAVSDTSSSTPTHQAETQFPQGFPGLAPSYELERQLSASSVAQKRAPVTGMDMQRGGLSAALLEVKQEECMEMRTCGGGVVKMEEGGGDGFSSSLQGGDRGKELLRHLLKEKASPASTPSPTRHAPPPACRQLSNDSLRSEEEEGPGSLVLRDSSGAELLKKNQRCRRPARPDKDRAPTKNKRRKKEEEEKSLHSSSDPLVTHLRQLSMLPLMEPVLRVDLSLFPPYGSSSLGKDSRLTGSFGNACLDGVTDFYSQLIYKQNNLSNPPTPPASLPPTPPPVVRQKMVNGFASTDELSRKDVSEQEVKGPLKQKGDGLQAINPPSKTVDVPASLPTPPHNNQEELRVQDSSERNSPEGFVPSSSPESVVDMEVSRYPDLSFIKLEPPSPCPSPTLPITPCAGGKGSAVKQEVKTEPNHQTPLPCSNTDLVAIAITLNPVAAQNVQGVMAAVAELLRVPVPANFQLSRAAGPEQSSLALLARVRVPLPQAAVGCRAQRPAAGSRPQCCIHCKAVLGNRLHVVQEFKQDGLSKPGSSLMFCSPNCSALYSNLQSRPTGSKPEVPELLSGTDHNPSSRAQHQYTNNMSSIAVHSLPHSFSFPPSSSPPPSFPPASAITMETQPRTDSLKVKVKLKPHPRALPPGEDSPTCRHGKKMKTCRWRRWSVSITFSRGPCAPNEEVAMPTEEEVDVLLQKLGTCLRPDSLPKDQRRCCFCHQQGDGQTDGPARLLNLDLDLWAHLNCALWSSEVYETQAGALINVELALRRGLTLRCAFCHQTGATSGCNRLRCTNTYHFTCALQAHCTFFKDKTMLCPLHKPRMVPLGGDRSSSCSPSSTPGVISDPMVLSDPYDSELRCFSVFRRVFVQRDEARQIAAIVQRGERQHTFRVGSLLFRTVGRLLPHQISTFHNETAIFPVGYHANRLYWSMRHSNRRCKYMCHIEEVGGQPLFKVKVVEKGYEDLVLTGPSPKAVWDQILEPVAQMRSSSGTLKLFPAYLKGEDLFGLTTSAVSRIIESLPGVEACERYTFRYGRNPLMEWPLAFNPSGSARSEPKPCQAKRPYLLTSVAPRCQGSVGAIVGAVPGVISLSPGESVAAAHQGRHSKAAQYRRMKAEWKSNVYLARSRIQGLGLYAARDIEKCTMVIEYIGAIIRSEVANRKERLYESQNRGVYMFRIDNDYVIDATITGGPARYINHSCAPNCITEVVNVEKENKIIISSCRRIQRGEELSYDYKFDLEDDQHKIPCHCGAVNCRKWMN